MLTPKTPFTISIQIIDDHTNPRERPEDCGYGEIRLSPGLPVPAVGDMISHDDQAMPLAGNPVIVLTRFFQFDMGSLHVTLACRRASMDEVGRRLKE